MKTKNPLPMSLLLLLLMLVPAACGTTTVISNTSTAITTTTVSAATSVSAIGDTTPNPFEDDVRARPVPLPESAETIVVEIGGESWVLPAAVCLLTDGDADIVMEAARQQVATVHVLVAVMISGWPSTTWGAIPTKEKMEIWERDLRVAGVTALTLAGLVGQQAALEQAWVDYEQSFADPNQGWGPPDEISSRVESWKAEALALTQAIAAFCSAD